MSNENTPIIFFMIQYWKPTPKIAYYFNVLKFIIVDMVRSLNHI